MAGPQQVSLHQVTHNLVFSQPGNFANPKTRGKFMANITTNSASLQPRKVQMARRSFKAVGHIGFPQGLPYGSPIAARSPPYGRGEPSSLRKDLTN